MVYRTDGKVENQAQEVDRMQISSCLRLEMEEEFPIKGHKEALGNDGNILHPYYAMVTQDICIWQSSSNCIF